MQSNGEAPLRTRRILPTVHLAESPARVHATILYTYAEVSADSILPLADAMDQLYHFFQRYVDELAVQDRVELADSFQLPDVEQQAWDLMLNSVRKHTLPPASLGKKFMGLYNKLHATWHATRLQAGGQ